MEFPNVARVVLSFGIDLSSTDEDNASTDNAQRSGEPSGTCRQQKANEWVKGALKAGHAQIVDNVNGS